MIREVLTIKRDNDTTVDDIVGLEIVNYNLTTARMGLPRLTATLMHKKCLDKQWRLNEYVELRGEKFFIRDTPTSSKDTSDVRYKHELVFKSEREQLADIFFYDVVTSKSDTQDKPASNSTDFAFYGPIAEFIDRLNCALLYAGVGDSILKTKTNLTTADTPVGDGYCVMLSQVSEYDLTEVKELSFSNQYILDALNYGYEQYEIPYEFRGKQIIFGAISTTLNYVFEYGIQNALLSVKKNNVNARLINRITFKGGTENIPYYYPNETEYGHVSVAATSGNSVVTTDKLTIVNMSKLLANVRVDEKITYRHNASYVGGSATLLGISYYLGTEDEQGLFQEYAPGDWIATPKDDLLLQIRFRSNETAPIQLSYIPMGIWTQDSASPGTTSNLLRSDYGLVSISLVQTASGGIPTDRNIPYKGRLSDGSLMFDEAPEGDYLLSLGVAGLPQNAWWQILDDFKWEITAIHGYYWKVGDRVINDLSEVGLKFNGNLSSNAVGDSIYWTSSGRIPTQTNLMPPIYRNTHGDERFYNATNDPESDAYVGKDGVRHDEAYIDPDTGQYYEFDNPYTEGNPKEYIYENDDIKPTIEGVTNASGQLLGSIADVAFDADDNDYLKIGSDDNNDKYEHSFFYIKLNRFDGTYGFDLFAHASQTDPMIIQMTSGPCNGCKFKIQVLETVEDGVQVWKNPVQTDGPNGNIFSGNYTDKVNKNNIQQWQQNSEQNSIWICVQKDVDTFGVIMPNRSNEYLPAANDTFNIINIDLPQPYILAAEKRAEQEMMRYMFDHNSESFTFDIDCSRIFFTERPDILDAIDEYVKIKVKYDGVTYPLYISSFEMDCSTDVLPSIKLTVDKELTTSQSFIESVAQRAASLIANATTMGGNIGGSGSGVNVAITDARHLSKIQDDYTPHTVKTDKAFEVGNYLAGASGGFFGKDEDTEESVLEVDRLHVRMKAVFQELEIASAKTIGGEQYITPGGGITITFVEKDEDKGVYRCYYKGSEDKDGIDCRYAVGDLVRCESFNIQGTKQHFFWREVVAVNNKASYFELKITDCATGSDAPLNGDSTIQLGHKNGGRRASAICLSTTNNSAPSITLYSNITTYSLNQKDMVTMGVEASTSRAFFKCLGDGFIGDDKSYFKFTKDGGVEIKGRISGESTIGGNTLNSLFEGIDDYAYLKEALAQKSITEGGLFLTSLIALGIADPDAPDDISKRTTWSGINGIVSEDKGNHSIAAWYGGNMADMEDYYDWDSVNREWKLKNGITQAQADAARIAQGVDRMDGTGYRAGGNFWWDADGNLFADPMTFIVGENYVGLNLALFQIYPNTAKDISEVNYITPSTTFSNIRLGLKNDYGTIEWDSERKMFKLSHGLYSGGDITAFGVGGSDNPSGGGGIDLAELQKYLTDNNYLTKPVADTLYQPLGTVTPTDGYVTLTTQQNITGQKNFLSFVDISANNIALGLNDADGNEKFEFGTGTNPTIFIYGGTYQTRIGSTDGGRGITLRYYDATNNTYPEADLLCGQISTQGHPIFLDVDYKADLAYNATYDNIYVTKPFAMANNRLCTGLNADMLDGKHLSDITDGNVASATKLHTARSIWGQSFDGTGNISGALTNATTITASTSVICREFKTSDDAMRIMADFMKLTGNWPYFSLNRINSSESVRIQLQGGTANTIAFNGVDAEGKNVMASLYCNGINAEGQVIARGLSMPNGKVISWWGGARMWYDATNDCIICNKKIISYNDISAFDENQGASMWGEAKMWYDETRDAIICNKTIVSENDITAFAEQ